MSAGADSGPDDWIAPGSSAPAAKTDSGSDDWTPSAGSAPAAGAGDDDSRAGAFGYGVIKGVPLGPRIAAAGTAATAGLMGLYDKYIGLNEDQKKALAGLPQGYDAASEALASKGGQAAEEHPNYYVAGTMLPQLLAPGQTTVKGAMGYGFGTGLNEGDSPAGSLAHGVLGAGTAGFGVGAAKALFPAVGFARSTVLDAAKRLGVTMPRYSVGLPITQMAGKIAHSVPGAAAPVEEATKESIEGLGTAAERAAGSATKESAGAAASSGLKDWIGPVSQADIDAKYNAVANSMMPNVKTPLSSTQAIAQQIAQRRQAAGLSGLGGAVDHVTDAIQRGDGLTYAGIKDLRSSIGEMLDSSVLPANMSKAELKQIYGGLSNDLESAAYNSGGQQGVAAHLAANDFAKQTAARREQLVSLLGGPKGDASNEAVFGAIKRAAGSTDAADIALLRQARSVIPPQSWDHVARGYVSTLGRDIDGNFSTSRFLTDYGKISPAAKDELFAQNGQLRQNLDDLHTVSQQWKSLGRYANPSGTAGHGAGIGMALEGARHPVEVLATFLGAKGMGKFLASPAGAGASANWVRAMASRNMDTIRNAATRIAATAGAQFGARVDPMALAALALHHYSGEEDRGGGDSGNQPQ
jgi:hypothetical protein